MVRMQSDARLPVGSRLGYKHIGDALFRIAKEEGLRTYWRGATPTGNQNKTPPMLRVSKIKKSLRFALPSRRRCLRPDCSPVIVSERHSSGLTCSGLPCRQGGWMILRCKPPYCFDPTVISSVILLIPGICGGVSFCLLREVYGARSRILPSSNGRRCHLMEGGSVRRCGVPRCWCRC